MDGTSGLAGRRCKPCEGGAPPLDPGEIAGLMPALHPDWQLVDEGRCLRRDFAFTGFNRTIGFVNAVAWIAGTEGHHPGLEVGYRNCVVSWRTHAIGGLSENDFICAAKVDRLLGDP